ncbi:MAG TPA: c-type cytochrome domain-containing protein [Cyclobacteriaceae bacterium]|nr:c-type cytochrome domain-containing protein [Cyclobacteriaceae bacterium]
MNQLFEFSGRFHPLLVHLPIGFLLIAVIFIWLKESEKVVRISLGLGALAAIASVTTGLMLESSGDYGSVNVHKWFGISLATVSIVLYFVPASQLKPGSILMTVLIFATGHFGGTLTHGPLLAASEPAGPDISQIDLHNAVFYADVVKPVLEARCYSCHGESKQKGRLRLDSPEAILKGGKNGKVLEPGNPEESDLIKRIDLPVDDEDHMPPKEKKQLTDQEKRLISIWIATGVDFSKKITELVNEKELNELSASNDSRVSLPDVEVKEPDEELITGLIEKGVAITPIARGSHFLQVNFVSVPEETQALLQTLKPIAANVVSLKITSIEDLSMMGDFKNLSNLNLSGTKITDVALGQLTKCGSITTLNLEGTKVTTDGVKKLKACAKLRYLNLYNTTVDQQQLREALPGVTIEFGGYQVPTLQTDTTVIKVK